MVIIGNIIWVTLAAFNMLVVGACIALMFMGG